ncbi:hypothetical protein EXIGLDRAFT_466782 [Exidia glandulosa HHB12029]|uniref:Uncharacterized protein n=1 Tax=Exidia glandulosa HHB12029 TaxID=1314781 RepID=A0A165AWK0_EXIGL|nr:hypothetical protein EXIGLDRAFT_466782 [Exidia glandulosa HHB12029]
MSSDRRCRLCSGGYFQTSGTVCMRGFAALVHVRGMHVQQQTFAIIVISCIFRSYSVVLGTFFAAILRPEAVSAH